MDPVTQSLLKEFVKSQQIAARDQAEQFEHFINYVVAYDLLPEEFDVEKISTGSGEFGIDGIAIIVNDILIEDEEQLDDIAENSVALSASLTFVQSKTSNHFDAGDMSKFFLAVTDFFNPVPTLVQSDRILAAHRVKERLYQYATKFLRGLPRLSLYFATTGTWNDDKNLVSIRDAHVQLLRNKHIFETVDFVPIDAAKAQKLYFQTKNSHRVTVKIPTQCTTPEDARRVRILFGHSFSQSIFIDGPGRARDGAQAAILRQCSGFPRQHRCQSVDR